MPPLITQNQNKDGQKTNDRDLPQMWGRNCAVRKLREYGLPRLRRVCSYPRRRDSVPGMCRRLQGGLRQDARCRLR